MSLTLREPPLDRLPAPEKERQNWLEHRGEWIYAAEYVSASLVTETADDAREAAEDVLASSRASPAARELAIAILSPGLDSPIVRETREEIAALKARLRAVPRDILGWVELSRLYAASGQPIPALSSMQNALALAPERRLVLRSAVRLHTHIGDAERAHRLVRDSPATPGDPWLVAAEIASASLAEAVPRHLGVARRILDDPAIAEAHKTELASALATLELERGSTKRSRRLFARSLLDPTDNSVAQAEWASTSTGVSIPTLRQRVAEHPRFHEANARAASFAAQPGEAFRSARAWFEEEPFSAEAAILGSAEAAKAGEFLGGAMLAQDGLRANSSSTLLRNNAAFCLAWLDRLEEARTHLAFARHEIHPIGEAEMTCLDATEGLVAYRSGDRASGLRLYTKAIVESSTPRLRALAAVMLITEEARVGPPGAVAMLDSYRRLIDDGMTSENRPWLDQMVAILGHAAGGAS